MTPSQDLIARNPNGGALWQGDRHAAVQSAGKFDLLVLCAQEFPEHYRLDMTEFRKRKTFVLFAPNDDAELSPHQLQIASMAASYVAERMRKGQRSLVTCMQGRNRSGLVSALALRNLYGISGDEAVRMVKEGRKGAPALTNPEFVKALSRLPAVR